MNWIEQDKTNKQINKENNAYGFSQFNEELIWETETCLIWNIYVFNKMLSM